MFIISMPQLENNWKNKTLETLENEKWGEPNFDSYLVTRTHQIRKIPLNQITLDDISMMLRQNFSLNFIVPLAIDNLDKTKTPDEFDRKEILETLLEKVKMEFWQNNKQYFNQIKEVISTDWQTYHFDLSAYNEAGL